ncbi:hypothetical protein DFH11DRAFT_1607354 [Phellopilus nigrolimitatus]|nr:hypothetical protein DFH11DRAFT_1607354 [Phellopilus nigrolimitatus]
MCHRKVPCVSYSCGHTQPRTEGELIDCGKRFCRLSAAHGPPRTLCGPDCGRTCIGARMPPELYSDTFLTTPCSRCEED